MSVRAFKYTLIALLVILSVSTYAYSDTVRSTLIGYSDFREIQPNLYVSPQISSDREQAIVTLVSDARSRIARKFGAPIAKPTIIVTSSEKEKNQFKLYGAPGKLIYAPWGNYLLLDQERSNIDVTAHELVHAEIAERLGYVSRISKMPTWLDEGIAMQVDHRPRYSQFEEIDKSEFERVVSLSSPGLFWTQNSEQNILNYQSSKIAVSTAVLPVIADNGLYGMLEELKKGKPVTDFYKFYN